jgi:hypothetical protein
MEDLRNLTEDELDILDTALVKYEFEIRDSLKLRLPQSQKQKLEERLAITLQIYDHLQSRSYKIKK